MENLQTSLFILNYFLIIYKQLSPLDRNPYSKRPCRLWNYILLAPGHLIEALGCQLHGKEDRDSSSTKTKPQSLKNFLMGTNFSKLHPKIQQKTRLAIRTLPHKIQQNILTHKAITSSYDRWMYLFKVLVSTAFIKIDMTDDVWLLHKATWYESFGET